MVALRGPHFAGWDIYYLKPDALLPEAVAKGVEPLLVIGAIAGG